MDWLPRHTSHLFLYPVEWPENPLLRQEYFQFAKFRLILTESVRRVKVEFSELEQSVLQTEIFDSYSWVMYDFLLGRRQLYSFLLFELKGA